MPSNRYPIAKGINNYFKSDKLKEIKNSLLTGNQHPYCKSCWDAEDNNVKSHRHNKGRAYSHKYIDSIHIRYNNICNFKCRICNPRFSSTWVEENKKHKYFEHEDFQIDKDIFTVEPNLQSFILKNRSTLKTINISGGEPLIADANLKFIKFLVRNNLTHITLSYSTNLSKINHRGIKILELLSKFKKVILSISVDGYGNDVEYSRFGFSWNNFIKNLKIAKANRLGINLVCVVSIYSIYSIPTLMGFAEKNKITLSCQPCFSPIFLSVQSLPVKEKDKITKFYNIIKEKNIIENFDYLQRNILDYMNREQIDSYAYRRPELKDKWTKKGEINPEPLKNYICNEEFKSFNSLLDKVRSQNFIETFPQFKDWYNAI